MPRLKLFLFGPPRIEVEGSPVEFERRKALALLIYLAVSGQPFSRDTLATLFWPDHSQSRARAYLRRDLAILNTSLIGDWLETDRDTVQFQNNPDLWLDTTHFRQLLAACRAHAHSAETVCTDCLPLLTEAAGLYTADFLAGFTLRDSPEFDDWQFFQTESFRQELALTLERLARGYSAQGEFEAALPYARRWLALDPLHEPAQRQLIQLYDGAGQPAAALRQYEEYIKLLDEELGLPPEEETVTLYEAIKAKRLLAPFFKVEEKKNKPRPQPAVPEAKVSPENLESPAAAVQGKEEAPPASPGPILPPSVQTPTPARQPDLPDSLASPPAVLKGEKLEQQIHLATSPDGVRIAYATLGTGPLLVKAGNPFTHLAYDRHSPVWGHWWEGLARHHTLVRYDERGCGLSDWNVKDFSMEAWIGDLETVVSQFGTEPFVLLGVSQGASVAIAYSVRHPERVSHLILYGGYLRGRFHRDSSPEHQEEAKILIDMIRYGWGKDTPTFRQVFATMFMPEGTPEQLNWFNDLARVTASPENAAAMEAAFYNINVTELAPKVTVPVLVLHPRGDMMCPFEEGQLMASRIPGARFVPLESKNHLLLENEPAWRQFLAEVHRFVGVEEDGQPLKMRPQATPVIPAQEELKAGQPSSKAIPFVGRTHEYKQLVARVDQARQKQGQIVLIEGEAGIGKSRLAEEVAGYAQAHNILVLWQKCYLLEQDLPYQALIDLVGQILGDWPVETFQHLPPASLAELALLVPEISSIFSQVAAASGGLAETRQARLFRALQQFITAPTRDNKALMLIIDDIHWADSITLQFLSYLAHHIANQPALLVCTYRAEEVSANPQLALTLQNLRRENYTSHIALSRLSLQDANTLVRSLSTGPTATPLSQWLYQETEGNPFFLISILQSLEEQGILTAVDAPASALAAETGWRINLQSLQQTDMKLTLPEALRQSVRERLQRVPPPARRILDIAAVYGRRFDFVTLQAITGENPPSLLNLVETLMARQLLQEKEEDRAYDFSHDKIREVVYYDLSQMRRILFHRQVAEALETAPGSRSGRLAEHFEKGEVWDKAITHLAQAGNRARQLFTMEEALRFYDRAIALAEQHPEAIPPAMRLDLYEQRGETRGLIGGQAEAAVADLQWVLEAAQMAGDQERERELLIRIGQVYRYGDDYRQALTYLRSALEVARRGSDERSIADALYHLGATLWSQGYNDQALVCHLEAVDICQELGLTDLVAVQAFHGLGEAYFLAGRAKEAIELYEQSLKLARQIGDKGYEAENLGNMGMAMQLYGIADYDRAKKTFSMALKISQAARLEWHSTQILGPLGLAFGLSGNYRQAFEHLHRSLRIAESIGAKRFHSLLLDMYGTLLQELNLPDRAKTAHENALELAQQADAGWWLPRIQANLAIDRLRLGDLAVEASLQTTLEQALSRHLQLHVLRCLEGLAELALVQGQPQQVLDYAGQLQRLAEPGEMREMMAQAHRWRGEALLALEQLEQAAAELEAARAIVEMIGRPRLDADIAAALGRVYHAQGEREKALHYEAQARQISEAIAGNWLEAAPQDDFRLDLLPPESHLSGPSLQASPERLLGQRYVQEELLTSGGMGQIYKGYDRETGRPVAIKRLKPELAAHNPEAVKRFIREGEILRRLNHPNIVKVLATFEIVDQPIIVMEYVSGGSLQDLLQQHPRLPLNRVLSIGLELADALARVHYLNIIHRDLKPANILLAEDGTPRLTDFGVAYLGSQVTRLTQEGAILGTTVYMSPEAWRGEPLDARSDIWSFGAVLYEMLAGQPPFAAEQVVAIMTAILNDPLPDLRLFRPDTPPALVELIKHMLIKERDLRIDSMRQVAAGLELIRRYL